jgi:hypothetical protein
MIDFACPSCRMSLRVLDSRVGRRVKCPYCDKSAPVPARDEAAPSGLQRRQARTVWLVAFLAGLVLCLLVWYSWHG